MKEEPQEEVKETREEPKEKYTKKYDNRGNGNDFKGKKKYTEKKYIAKEKDSRDPK